MHRSAFLALSLLIACLAGCGGGGGKGAPALSFAASPTTISVAGSGPSPAPQATILLTVAGTVPSAGVYYAWTNTTNMISGITGYQTSGNQVTLTVTFGDPTHKPVGTYQDTIEVEMAMDQQGQNLIAGSPQTIQVAYQVEYPAASLSQVNPASTWAGGPGFTVSVTGQGFPADAQVQWNGSPLVTTWVSATSLQAQVPASAIAEAGSALLTVGAKDMQTSAPLYVPVANARTLILEGGMDCAWDPVHGTLYTCMLNADNPQGPSIQAIDPATGKVVAQVACGSTTFPPLSGPNRLAVSDDGSYLYAFVYNLQAGVPGTIVRYLLPSLTLDPSYSVPLASGTADSVTMMAVAPGAPHTLAVALDKGANAAGVEILDDTVPRGSVILGSPANLNALTWGTDSSALYVFSWSLNNTCQLSTVAVTSSGPTVQVTQPVSVNGNAWDIHWLPATGHVYVGSGQVYDPATGNLVGTCGSGTALAMDKDPGLGLGFYLGLPSTQPSPLTWGVEVTSQNLATFGYQDSVFVPVGMSPTGSLPPPTRVLRCGPSTLVLYGGYEMVNAILIVSGPFAQGQ